AGIRELGGRPLPQLPGVAADPAMTLAGAASAPSQASFVDLDTRAASVADEATVAQHLPSRQPGATGLTWGENGFADSGSQRAAREQPGGTGARPTETVEVEAATGMERATGMEPADHPAAQAEAPAGPTVEKVQSAQTGPPELDGLPVRVRQANLAPQLRTPTTPMPAAADEPAA